MIACECDDGRMAEWRKLAAGSVFVWLANVFIQFASGKWKVRGPWSRVFVLATFLLPKVQSKQSKNGKLLCVCFIFQSPSLQTHKSPRKTIEQRTHRVGPKLIWIYGKLIIFPRHRAATTRQWCPVPKAGIRSSICRR